MNQKTNGISVSITAPRWLVSVIIVQFVVIVVLGFHTFQIRLSPVEMTYEDWVAILLTALGLIISVLAVFLGVLAFIGWQTFDRRVHQRVQECLIEGFGVNGNLRKHLQNAVERVSLDFAGEKYDADGDHDA